MLKIICEFGSAVKKIIANLPVNHQLIVQRHLTVDFPFKIVSEIMVSPHCPLELFFVVNLKTLLTLLFESLTVLLKDA